MNDKILVTYASQGGSTAGIAEAIGQTLSTNETVVDLCPIKEITDLRSYRAVVIGSAVHSGKWMPEAMAFVEGNQNTLRRIPTAIFQVCMMLATSNEQYNAWCRIGWPRCEHSSSQPLRGVLLGRSGQTDMQNFLKS